LVARRSPRGRSHSLGESLRDCDLDAVLFHFELSRTVELILTVTGTADGEWQAELKNGSKWVAKGLEIPAAAVSRAAKELHSDLSGPIDEVINQAREAQAAKVAALEAELEKAKQALAELDA